MKKSRPDTKMIMNIQIAAEEKAFVKKLAAVFQITQTMVIRNMIREEMKRMAKK